MSVYLTGAGYHLVLTVMVSCTTSTTFPDLGPAPTEMLADRVLSPYLVPFLALSFVLLAAAIGAIVLARKD